MSQQSAARLTALSMELPADTRACRAGASAQLSQSVVARAFLKVKMTASATRVSAARRELGKRLNQFNFRASYELTAKDFVKSKFARTSWRVKHVWLRSAQRQVFVPQNGVLRVTGLRSGACKASACDLVRGEIQC